MARQSELQHVVGLQVGAGLGRGRRPTTTTLHQSGFGVCYLEVVSPFITLNQLYIIHVCFVLFFSYNFQFKIKIYIVMVRK